MGRLREPLDAERREELKVLVTLRWVLVVAIFFVIDYRHGTDTPDWVLLNALVAFAVGLNGALQLRLSRHRPIPLALPLAAGTFDLVGLTAAIAAVDGFKNPSFTLYYPALLAYSLAFTGRWSIAFAVGIIAAYAVGTTTQHAENIDLSTVDDQKAMVLRLATMGSTVLAANLVTRTERTLRLRAAAREAERQQEVFALEARARAVERSAEDERRHLLREVHDGVSQGVFMLNLGLEAASRGLHASQAPQEVAARLDALGRVAKETLLETRGLLFDLHRVMSGEGRLSELAGSQAKEFEDVTGIRVQVEVRGDEVPLPAGTVAEVYRVIQEGLSNIYRHAGANYAGIEVAYEPGLVRLEVHDDGKGFDPAERRRAGHGLRTMAERAASLGGALTIESTPGDGTRLRLEIPRGAGHQVAG